MKKCGTCFRFVEKWNNATEAREILIAKYKYKPRKGIKTMCIALAHRDEQITNNSKACKSHGYRWIYNLKSWYKWSFKDGISLIRNYVRVPIGRLRKPIELPWVNYFDGCRDEVIPNGIPECPRCKEMPYSTEQCVFCGQRFIQKKDGGKDE